MDSGPSHRDGYQRKTALTSPRTIAIVDDDDLVRSATASLVRSLGEAAIGFSSARAFLDADLDGVVCVISDVQMPGMSGIEMLQELRRRPSAPPLMLMTSFPSDKLREQADAAGAIAFLEKPVSGSDLIDVLKRTLPN